MRRHQYGHYDIIFHMKLKSLKYFDKKIFYQEKGDNATTSSDYSNCCGTKKNTNISTTFLARLHIQQDLK